MIYFIQAGTDGPIKIGLSTRPRERMIAHQISNWQQLFMRLIQDGDEKLERKLKKQFKDYHIRGEWFWPSNELMRYIGRYAGPYKEGQRIRVTRKHSRKRRREGIISKVIFHCERNGMPKGLDFPQYEIELDDGDSVRLHAPDITVVKKSDYV